MAMVEAWLLDGPADGRMLAVELTADGQIPQAVRLPQIGVYVGSADLPAAPSEHLYMRTTDVGEQVVYQYAGCLDLDG